LHRRSHDLSAPAFRDAIDRIVEGGHRRGLSVTMHAVSAAQAAGWLAMGFDELVLTADIELLRGAFAELISGARDAIGAEPARSGPYAIYGGRPEPDGQGGRKGALPTPPDLGASGPA
jgi:hypothetical protein